MPLHRTEVHVDQPLTNVAKKFARPELVGDRLLPVVNVKKESDVYYEFDRWEMRDLEGEDRRANGAPATEFRWKPKGTAPYVCEEYALKRLVTDRTVRNADNPVMPRQRTTSNIAYALMLQREIRVASLMTTGVSSTAAGLPWDDPGADIEEDVLAAKTVIRDKVGVNPNTIVIPEAVIEKIILYLKGSVELALGQKVSFFEMPDRWLGMNVVVHSAKKNTAAEGEDFTETIEAVWPTDTVGLYWVNPTSTPSLEEFSFGWTIRAMNFQVKSWREESRDGAWIQAQWIQTEKVVAIESGHLITGVLA